MEVLILRLQAPLMSFGETKIDNISPTIMFPGASMIAGFLANALGFDHAEAECTQRLQDRLILASRQDLAGKLLVDYQTVDLSQPRIAQAWTTYGKVEKHGGSVNDGTHQRWVYYISDAVYTVAVALGRKIEPDDPRVQDLAVALRHPARPIFFGRKSCVPSAPPLLGLIEADNVLHALQQVPFSERCLAADGRLLAQWPAHLGLDMNAHVTRIADKKDWKNRVHLGRTSVRQGLLKVTPSWSCFVWHVRKDVQAILSP